ncbi:MAG TPA: N-acyl homoserine lactonase family protein [Trebonia sp.]
MSLSIRALGAGRLVGLHKPTITYMRGWGSTHLSPMIMFVIDGGAAPIVVDTGPPDIDRVLRYHNYVLEQSPAERPSAVLRRAGIDPAEVPIVVNTHLHWDHCSNDYLFPRADIYVQRKELEYAASPLQWHNAAFEHYPELEPPWRSVEGQLKLADGDCPIAPGVSLVALPGHTPGSQGVLVETDNGRYLIAGDCVDTYENWAGDEAADHIPSGLYTNLIEYDASFRKIESLDCQVIPSHDEAVLKQGHFR